MEEIIIKLNGLTYSEWTFIKEIVESNFNRQLQKSSFEADEKTLKSINNKFIY